MPGSGVASDVTKGENTRLIPTPDGRAIDFLAPIDGSYELWRISVADSAVKRLTQGRHHLSSFDGAATGGRTRHVYLRSAPTTPPDVWVLDQGSEPRMLTSFNREVLDELTLIEPVERCSQVDGRTIQGWFMPVRQAFAIEMVGPRDIGNAVAINSAMFNGARVVGPAVAGLTIGAFGIAPAFAINAVSFLAVIIGLTLMRDDELHLARLVPRPRSAGAVVENLREGLAFVRHTPIVLLAVTTVGLVATFGMSARSVARRARRDDRMGRRIAARRGCRPPPGAR